MNKYPKLKWIYSAWGNDLFYFQNDPDYLQDIKQVLPKLDYMYADCTRDYEIAKKHGFNGTFLGVYPTGGGYEFNLENEIRPIAGRNVILVKGYQNLFGECIPVLKAIKEIKNELEDYEIIVFGAEQDTVEYVEKSDLLNFTNFSLLKNIGRGTLMKLMGTSLIYIGNSISDGMPNTLLEAIIMGAFPIQSNPGGATAELIEHNKNGFLIQNPLDVSEIKSLILKATNDRTFLAQAVEYNFKEIKPKLEREFVRQEVLEKYRLVEKAVKP
jgi:glycosyltransferase involved in cell wall biosynthesis